MRPPLRKPVGAECSKTHHPLGARELVVSAVADEDGRVWVNPQPADRFQVNLRIGLGDAGRAGKDSALEMVSQQPEQIEQYGSYHRGYVPECSTNVLLSI